MQATLPGQFDEAGRLKPAQRLGHASRLCQAWHLALEDAAHGDAVRAQEGHQVGDLRFAQGQVAQAAGGRSRQHQLHAQRPAFGQVVQSGSGIVVETGERLPLSEVTLKAPIVPKK